MNGKHVELYTFGVYVALQEVDALKSLAMEYHESFTADEPSLGLVCTIDGKRYEFLLMSRQDHKNYYLWLQQPQSPNALMAAHLAQEGFAIDDGFLSKTVESNGLQSAILDLDASLVDIVAQEVA